MCDKKDLFEKRDEILNTGYKELEKRKNDEIEELRAKCKDYYLFKAEYERITNENAVLISINEQQVKELAKMKLMFDLVINSPDSLYSYLTKGKFNLYNANTQAIAEGRMSDYEELPLDNYKRNRENRYKDNKADCMILSTDIFYNLLKNKIGIAIEKCRFLIEIEKDNEPFESKEMIEQRIFLYKIQMAKMQYSMQYFFEANLTIDTALEIQSINDMYKIQAYNIKGESEKGLFDNDTANNKYKYYKSYQEAIKLYEKIKKEHNNAVLRYEDYSIEKEAAISYTLLGDFYVQRKRKEAAKTNYHKALDIYTGLNEIGKIEPNLQSIVSLKLAAIYDNENKTSMVKKCFERIQKLENLDVTIKQNPKMNLQRAIYNMQTQNFSEANIFYLRAIEYYTENQNLYKQELIETLFLAGLNHFYAKSHNQADNYFSHADSLLSQDKTLVGKDFVCLKALCMAAKGITKKEQGDGNGLLLYNQARDMVKGDGKLSDKEKKILLKNMAHLRKYKYLRTLDFIFQTAGGGAVFVILLIL